jgi:hypothetical protein
MFFESYIKSKSYTLIHKEFSGGNPIFAEKIVNIGPRYIYEYMSIAIKETLICTESRILSSLILPIGTSIYICSSLSIYKVSNDDIMLISLCEQVS